MLRNFKHIIKEDHICDLINIFSDMSGYDDIDFSDESMAMMDIYAYDLDESPDENTVVAFDKYLFGVVCDKAGENIVMITLAPGAGYHIEKYNIHTGTSSEKEVLHLIKYFILTIVMDNKFNYIVDKNAFSKAAGFICTVLNI